MSKRNNQAKKLDKKIKKTRMKKNNLKEFQKKNLLQMQTSSSTQAIIPKKLKANSFFLTFLSYFKPCPEPQLIWESYQDKDLMSESQDLIKLIIRKTQAFINTMPKQEFRNLFIFQTFLKLSLHQIMVHIMEQLIIIFTRLSKKQINYQNLILNIWDLLNLIIFILQLNDKIILYIQPLLKEQMFDLNNKDLDKVQSNCKQY